MTHRTLFQFFGDVLDASTIGSSFAAWLFQNHCAQIALLRGRVDKLCSDGSPRTLFACTTKHDYQALLSEGKQGTERTDILTAVETTWPLYEATKGYSFGSWLFQDHCAQIELLRGRADELMAEDRAERDRALAEGRCNSLPPLRLSACTTRSDYQAVLSEGKQDTERSDIITAIEASWPLYEATEAEWIARQEASVSREAKIAWLFGSGLGVFALFGYICFASFYDLIWRDGFHAIVSSDAKWRPFIVDVGYNLLWDGEYSSGSAEYAVGEPYNPRIPGIADLFLPLVAGPALYVVIQFVVGICIALICFVSAVTAVWVATLDKWRILALGSIGLLWTVALLWPQTMRSAIEDLGSTTFASWIGGQPAIQENWFWFSVLISIMLVWVATSTLSKWIVLYTNTGLLGLVALSWFASAQNQEASLVEATVENLHRHEENTDEALPIQTPVGGGELGRDLRVLDPHITSWKGRAPPPVAGLQSEEQPPASSPEQASSNSVTSPLYVTGSRVNVRAAPSADAARISSLPRGARVEGVARDGSWVEIRQPGSGVRGWMHEDYLSWWPTQAESRATE